VKESFTPPASQLTRQPVAVARAILFTDIVGSTGYFATRGDQAGLQMLEWHNRCLFPLVEQANGRIIKTIGDSIFAVFDHPADALRAAFAMQHRLQEVQASLPVEEQIHVRVGVHYGLVTEKDNDVFGDAVNLAERVKSSAGAGQIVVSRTLRDMVRADPRFTLSSIGPRTLKGATEPMELFELKASPPLPGAARLRMWARRTRRVARSYPLAVATVALVLVLAAGLWWRQRLLGRTGPPHIGSLAVLPLQNLSRDPGQDYFVEGVTDELITNLGKIGALGALRVSSRTSTMHYKGTRKTLAEIGRELNVDAVVEGELEFVGNRVRINAKLIHAPTDRQLWAESYEHELRDVLRLQGELASTIANKISIMVKPQERARLLNARPINPELYALYLKGRFYWNKRNEEGLKTGVRYFEQAIEKDPGYAPAYAGLADSYAILANLGLRATRQAYPKATEAALKALEIDDTLAEAHTSLAFVKTNYDWDWSAAERGYKRAIELNPNYATAHQWFASHLAVLGRFDEAMEEIKRAQELDPLSPIISTNVARVFYYKHEYDKAIEELQRTLEFDPDFVWAHGNLARAYSKKGMHEQAIIEIQKAAALSKDNPHVIAGVVYIYTVEGKRDEALKALHRLTELSKQRYVHPYVFAGVYAGLGEKTQALAWLEKAYKERDDQLAMLKVDDGFDPLRSQPRFQEILRRLAFPAP